MYYQTASDLCGFVRTYTFSTKVFGPIGDAVLNLYMMSSDMKRFSESKPTLFRKSAPLTETPSPEIGQPAMLRTSKPSMWNSGNTKRPTISGVHAAGAHTTVAAGMLLGFKTWTRLEYCARLNRTIYLIEAAGKQVPHQLGITCNIGFPSRS